MRDYLNHSSHELRREGMVGLLLRGDPRYVATIRDRISTAIRSADPADRVFAAGVVRNAALPDLALIVLRLLKDDDIQVRKAALEACVGIDDRDVLEVAVEAFAEPQLCSTAALVMARAGESVVPLLDAAWARHTERSTRLRLVRCLGRIGGPQAIDVLRRLMDCNDELLRTQVLQSLSMCGYTAEGEAIAAIEARIHAEVGQATWKLSMLNDLPESPAFELLRSSLENEIAFCRKRLFLLVSYFGDSKVLLSTRDNYFSGVRERVAYAIEILDLKMPHKLRGVVLPLLEDLPLAIRLEKLGKVFPIVPRSAHEHLRAIVTGQDASAWTRAVAMRAVMTIPVPELVPFVKESIAAQELGGGCFPPGRRCPRRGLRRVH